MEWISVKDRLPETGNDVLIVRTNPSFTTSGYMHHYGHWVITNLRGSSYKESPLHKVTHWMPLPQPPQQ